MNRQIVAGLLMLPALCLTGCGGHKNVFATADETVHTALFDYAVSDVAVVDSYAALMPADGDKLVTMDLTVTNTCDQTLTMFAGDFQLQWGDGEEDFGTCLEAVDDTMVPYSYTLEPGESYTGVMAVEVPAEATELTVAYQEMLANGKRGTAYFVEAAL